MDPDRFRNVRNLDLVEPNLIRDLIFLQMLFVNFSHYKCRSHALPFDDVRYQRMLALTSVAFFLANMKCGLVLMCLILSFIFELVN